MIMHSYLEEEQIIGINFKNMVSVEQRPGLGKAPGNFMLLTKSHRKSLCLHSVIDM